MIRLVALLVVLAGCAAAAVLGLRDAAAARQQQTVVLRVGDEIRVDGEPIGCRVSRKQGDVYVDCRRAGRLAGTYGTLLSGRKVMAVRFRSSQTAKVVFEARHRGLARRCGAQ